MKNNRLFLISALVGIFMVACQPNQKKSETEKAPVAANPEWVSIFNGNNLDGWTIRGKAGWKVEDGVLIGNGANGHIYAAPELTDLEVKGTFRITDQGGGSNSGLYFRSNPPADNPDSYPKGYEAQICHIQDAFTGWLWKPGTPTGKATKMITEDGEWFNMRVKAVGPEIKIWVNDELVMTYEDDEYKKGFFAIQCHNEGMTIEAKELFYKDLAK
jgi:hypothetical protein